MPKAVTSGNLYLYADDTTVHCIGSAVDEACNLLNNALDELNKWCITNSLTPHSSKCSTGDPSLVHTLWLPLQMSKLHGLVTQGCWALLSTENLPGRIILRNWGPCLSINWTYWKSALFVRENHFLICILSWFSLQWHTASLSGGTVTTWITINPWKHYTVVLEG